MELDADTINRISRYRKGHLEPMLGSGDYTNGLVIGLYRELTGDDVSYMPLGDFLEGKNNVNKRLLGALTDANILTVGDAIELSEEELARKAGIAEMGVDMVKGWLESYGLSLRGDNREPWHESGDMSERRVNEVFRNPDVVGILKGEGVDTVGELREMGERGLRDMDGMGKTRIFYVKEILGKLGVTLEENGGTAPE